MKTILGQETRVIKFRSVEAGVTTTGGHIPGIPLAVNSIMAVAPVPKGFEEVADIRTTGKGVELVSRSGKSSRVPLDPAFLAGC